MAGRPATDVLRFSPDVVDAPSVADAAKELVHCLSRAGLSRNSDTAEIEREAEGIVQKMDPLAVAVCARALCHVPGGRHTTEARDFARLVQVELWVTIRGRGRHRATHQRIAELMNAAARLLGYDQQLTARQVKDMLGA